MSKGLEALVRVARQLKVDDENCRDLDIIEKGLKALEIIKKDVNLVTAVMSNCKGGKEYDLLKEVLL